MRERLKARWRAAVIGAQTQVIIRLDQLRADVGGLDQRISELDRRLDHIERLSETTGMRAAGATEEVTRVTESTSRLSQRIAEIERRLGAANGGR